jgi:hypothetical protein
VLGPERSLLLVEKVDRNQIELKVGIADADRDRMGTVVGWKVIGKTMVVPVELKASMVGRDYVAGLAGDRKTDSESRFGAGDRKTDSVSRFVDIG